MKPPYILVKKNKDKITNSQIVFFDHVLKKKVSLPQDFTCFVVSGCVLDRLQVASGRCHWNKDHGHLSGTPDVLHLNTHAQVSGLVDLR
jgi:hypothetical protein